MRTKRLVWLILGLLCVAGAWFIWHGAGVGHGGRQPVAKSTPKAPLVTGTVHWSSQSPTLGSTNQAQTIAIENRQRLSCRLSNTTKPLAQLMTDPHAILLANALIDTASPLNLSIPKNLQASGNPGAYIVQAHGPISASFRAMLAQAGVQIVAYIPNDAYLISATPALAGALVANPMVQAVVPYEPYYKVQPTLLAAMLNNGAMPQTLTVAAYPNTAGETLDALQKAGATVLDQQTSPFGMVFTVQYPGNISALAQLPQVQIIEAAHKRVAANDLSRATVGVTLNTQTTTNYLGLTGSNVLVEINDTGIDTNHPDFTLNPGTASPVRVIGTSYLSMVDTNGHGTHVAGTIAGNGFESTTVTNAQGSIMPGTNYQFRGMAPLATLLSQTFYNNDDYVLQATAALTNALISNNSWDYGGDSDYDLAAASYDAATRDALPLVTGSQPVLFVFAAGDSGGGDNDGFGGVADTILSPATAKNVITVGALEQYRYITNIVTDANGNSNAVWEPETDSSDQVADFSSRGNVGIGFEGTYGRYKPDVVTPGVFVISDRSEQWDQAAYYNPTNYDYNEFSDQVGPYGINYYTYLFIPENAVEVDIQVVPDDASPLPFSTPTVYLWEGTSPYGPTTIPPTTNAIAINGAALAPYVNEGWTYAVSNNVNETIGYNVIVDVITTNDDGNYLEVLSNLNDSIGPWYRYESGTSMSAGDVSGVLALMQQYYSNNFAITPSPALMKAALINGARSEPDYDFQVDNSINFQGWGLISLPDTLPAGITNVTGVACDNFFVDQSATNALATGDSQTYNVKVNTNAFAQNLPLRVTLAWTDPPGDPAAGIKLVNSLELIVTNLDNPTNYIVYYGNDIAGDNTFNTPENPTNPPSYDVVNNVQNIFIPKPLGQNYSVTVLGREVNVNAVSAQTNSYNKNNTAGIYAPNVVQDYALVIACGEGEVTNAITVTNNGIISNPTSYQQINFLNTNQINTALFDQFVGASTPLLGTNLVDYGSTNEVVTLGMTNQWHFYVVTNTLGYANVAFVTFLPDTLSLPRMGVFADSITNATQPEADIDLFVASGTSAATNAPALTNLDPNVISSCVNGTQIGETVGGIFYGASLGRGGTEYVVDTNSTSGEVYYVGVQSEDQLASEYGFISIISSNAFSQMNNNGDEVVNGNPVPVPIVPGSPALSVAALTFGIALFPIQIQNVVVTNIIPDNNFGDLVGTLSFTAAGGAPGVQVLNNHDSKGNTTPPVGNPQFIYDDSGQTPNSQRIDGPGSLNNYVGEQGNGVWMLSEANTAPGQSGEIANFWLLLQKHNPLGKGVLNIGSLTNEQWYYNYIDVPPGATNLTIYITNGTPVNVNPIDLFINFGSEPTLSNYDKMIVVSNGTPFPNGSLSVGLSDVPPLQPGVYWIGVYNPGPNTQSNITVQAIIMPTSPVAAVQNYTSVGATNILDDAVSYFYQYVPTNEPIVSLSVGLCVQHPRISDLVFYLISPDGTRDLLMQNRGGDTTEGCGGTAVVTNVTTVVSNYTVLVTNITVISNNFEGMTATDLVAGQTVGGWTVTANEVSVVTDPANVYQGTNFLALASGGITYTLPALSSTATGGVYTLSFAYRGPGIVGWWRGENDTTDSVYGVTTSAVTNITYSSGEVGRAFSYDGSTSTITVPQSTLLAVTNFTFEGWINPADLSTPRPVIDYSEAGIHSPAHLWINTEDGLDPATGYLFGNIRPSNVAVNTTSQVLTLNKWNHVAMTVDLHSFTDKLYCNGSKVASTTSPSMTPPATAGVPVNLGFRAYNSLDMQGGYRFDGLLDELSIYSRALSDSEINAIYNRGTSGKYDPVEFNISPALSLAEFQVSTNGQTFTNLYGNNTTWQTYTTRGSLSSSGSTVLTITGLEPGTLLDSISVTNVQVGVSNVTQYFYYTNVVTNVLYLTFTEDTNLTTTPIKFAPTPFVPNTNTSIVFTDSFEGVPTTDYTNGQTFGNGWTVLSNEVTIENDPANAYAGSNYLALASGVISNSLPTVAGESYTLTFAYRGPGIVSMWRGEGSANDSVDGNNGTPSNITYTGGEVGQAFDFNGSSSQVMVPASGNLNVGINNAGFTLDTWVNPVYTSGGTIQSLMEWNTGTGSGAAPIAVQFGFNGGYDGDIYANIMSTTLVGHYFQTAEGIMTSNTWQHVALAFNEGTGVGTIYHNGAVILTANLGTGYTPWTSTPLYLGCRPNGNFANHFDGDSDEMGIYNRVLSDAEINAIYNKGSAGKFDASASFPQNLAEAQASLNGQTPTLYGNNTTWQIETITFTATQNGTPFVISGIEPGMLLDNFALTQTAGNLYYQPEQALSIFDGQSSGGLWTLEVQDDRAGAGLSNSLVSWQLQFVLANTNAIPGIIQGGIGETNFVPGNSIAWYQINVPTNASIATNILEFASLPVNVWFSTNVPPTITNVLYGDVDLIPNSTGGTYILTTNTAPPTLVPGGTYYLGVQNNNNTTINYAIQVNFNHGNASGSGLPLIITGVMSSGASGTTLNWTASPTAQFEVQWTDDLTQPWNTDTNIITSADGNFTFTDDGSQTATLGAARFYRLVQISP